MSLTGCIMCCYGDRPVSLSTGIPDCEAHVDNWVRPSPANIDMCSVPEDV